MFRAKTYKERAAGTILKYTIDASGVKDEVRKKYGSDSASMVLKVMIANAQSRVGSDALTMERFKCATREIVVPAMMEARRMPATSTAIGFDKMAHDLNLMLDLADSIEAWNSKTIEEEKKASLSGFKEKSKSSSAFLKQEFPEIEKWGDTKIADWINLYENAEKNRVKGWLGMTGIYSASVSQKELYNECEMNYPGTIFWSGVHTIMTDAANNEKAQTVPVAMQQRFLNSNFYTDFKRKQIARGIKLTQTTAYMNMLRAVAKLAARYVKTGTGLTAAEVEVMESIAGFIKSEIRDAEKAPMDLENIMGGQVSRDPETLMTATKLKSQKKTADIMAQIRKQTEEKGKIPQ